MEHLKFDTNIFNDIYKDFSLPIAIFDLDGNIKYFNKAFTNFLTELVEINPDELNLFADINIPQILKQQLFDEKEIHLSENLYFKKNIAKNVNDTAESQSCFENAIITLFTHENETISDYILLKIDNTRQQHIRQILTDELFNNVEEAILISEMVFCGNIIKEKIIKINSQTCNLSGFSREELFDTGVNFKNFSDKEKQEKFSELLNEREVQHNAILITKNGDEKEVEVHTKLFQIKGKTFALSILKDISDVKIKEDRLELANENLEAQLYELYQIQKVLKESEEKYKTLFYTIKDAVFVNRIFVNDTFSRFIEVNDVASELTGYSREELLEINPTNADAKTNFDYFRAEKILDKTDAVYEDILISKSGEKIPIEIDMKKFEFKGFPSVMTIIRDISKRKEAEQKIDRINKFSILLSEINEAIFRIHDLKKLCNEICRISTETDYFKSASIGIIDYEYQKFLPIAISIKEDEKHIETKEFLRGIKFPDWMSKYEVIQGKNYISNDIETDKLISLNVKKQFLENGLLSMGIFPIWSGKKVVGVFGLGSREKNFFTKEDILFIERLTTDISLAFISLEYDKHKLSLKEGKTVSISKKEKKEKKGSLIPKIISTEISLKDIITQNEDFLEQLKFLPGIAESDSTVLIYGESGTGKELIASAIKNLSKRNNSPFLIVNCAALPDNLLESELFGYVKGSFTGAVNNKIGLFQAADEGTIFLDEIGDTSLNMQVKILRTIQEGEIIPIGSVKSIKINTRFICATNKKLGKLVKEGLFRKDLYYRLNVVRINIPPLRRRKEDILPLIEHFIKIYNERNNRQITGVSPKALRMLERYNYPGNIRELKNLIETAFIFCNGEKIDVPHLPKYIRVRQKPSRIDRKNTPTNTEMKSRRENNEKEMILSELEKNRWNIKKTSESLGIHRITLWRKMKKYGI